MEKELPGVVLREATAGWTNAFHNDVVLLSIRNWVSSFMVSYSLSEG